MHHVEIMSVRSGKATLCTETRGAPSKGTILMVMGATASMAWWPDGLLDALADGGYRVIRFDLRDTGQSTTQPPGAPDYDVADLAADLIAILDAHEVAAAHLVGMSLGGYLGQIAALQWPGRVRSLTLIASEPLSTAYDNPGISPEFMAHFGAMGELDWSDRDAVAAFMLRIAELSAGPATAFDRDAALKRIERELDRTPSIRSAFNHALLGGETGSDLVARAIRQPTLVIHGTDDPVIPVAAAHASVGAIANAQLMLLEGRGHELAPADLGRIAEAILVHAATAPA